MSNLPGCPLQLVLARRSGCLQPEIIAVSSWQKAPRRADKNFGAIIDGPPGRKLFFKHNLGGNLRYIVTNSERRRRDICNILASGILTDVFAVPCVEYHESFLLFANGQRLRGIACNYIDGPRWLQMVPPQEVLNQEEALWQIVVLTWLGDIDRINNPCNDFVTRDGRYVTLDFDFCFTDGVSIFGFPIASRTALEYFTSLKTIKSMIATILRFTDADIIKIVRCIGEASVSDWSEEDQSGFAGVLIRNRERLRNSMALERFSHKMRHRRLLDRCVTRFYGKLINFRKIRGLLKTQGPLKTLLQMRNAVLLRNEVLPQRRPEQ